MVIDSVSTCKKGVVASGSHDGGTVTNANALNSMSGERNESNWWEMPEAWVARTT